MKSQADFQAILEEAVAASERAGEMILALSRERSFEIRQKLGAEIVTTADLRSDAMLREDLGASFPQFRFLSEEVAVEGRFDFSGPVWVIDPIDGTANYAHGHPYVSISVALVVDGEPCIGVVHAPFFKETYTAIAGSGARCNGCPIRVSNASELSRSLVGTGLPHDRSDLTTAMARVLRMLTTCQDVRRGGSPALDICWVAAGRLDGHCESLAPWDIAAAGLIATEAGAMRGNLLAGNEALPRALRGEEFIVAAPGIFDPLCQLLKAQ